MVDVESIKKGLIRFNNQCNFGGSTTPLNKAIKGLETQKKMIDDIQLVFTQVDEGHITAPSHTQLVEYQLELIQEILNDKVI